MVCCTRKRPRIDVYCTVEILSDRRNSRHPNLSNNERPEGVGRHSSCLKAVAELIDGVNPASDEQCPDAVSNDRMLRRAFCSRIVPIAARARRG